jgi:hypothetical protein
MNIHDIAKQIRSFADELEASKPEQPALFALPTPPPGMRWHRVDGWTAEMLPPGTRPLEAGENHQPDDEFLAMGGNWQRCTYAHKGRTAAYYTCPYRTTRSLLFTHEGHEWAWHRAGDPMPCDGGREVVALTENGTATAKASRWQWGDDQGKSNILGWRYADAEQPDPYAELKKAHAEGKVIQGCIRGHWIDCPHPTWKYPLDTYRIKPDDDPPWIVWHGGPCPLKDDEVEEWEYKMHDGSTRKCDSPNTRRWEHIACANDIIAYRVLKWRTPKPKVQLGPEDVPPLSLIRRKPEQDNGQQWHWRCVSYVHGVGIQCGNRGYKWEELQKDYQINRPRHRDADGNPTLWEACEK